MTKIYTVKSNARRDARKRGLSPDLVVPVEGGFIIQEPETAAEPATESVAEPATELVTKPKRKRDSAKRGMLRDKLLAGWCSLPDLMSALGWQAHTVRGAISTLAKTEGLRIERARESGITSYRAVEQ